MFTLTQRLMTDKLIISLSIRTASYFEILGQVRLLVGRAATPDFQKKLTWMCINHDPRIIYVDTVTAFHTGNNFLVEIHIVLPESMAIKEAHDIQEALQHKLETIRDVERAFVHIDYETHHDPTMEHKVL